MNTNAQLQHYEELVRFETPLLEQASPQLAEYITELRGAWEHRSVVRHLRLLEGMPICNGDGHCLEHPTAHCMTGRHETCPEHIDSCYLCPFLAAIETDA